MLNEIQGADCRLSPNYYAPPEATSEGAVHQLSPEQHMPSRSRIGKAGQATLPKSILSSQTPIGGASPSTPPIYGLPLRNSTVGEVVAYYRRYEDLRRAHKRLHLQALSVVRHAGEGPAVDLWLAPYQSAMEPLAEAITDAERTLSTLAKRLPANSWVIDLRGMSHRFHAMVVGECGRAPNEYRSVSALWKRMGLAVIDGERQRRVRGDDALKHGYAPQRRSLIWNIGESILKAQIRKNDAGARCAIGELGQVYIERRAYEVETKGEVFSHARAKRYMEKRFLRQLWQAWNEAERQSEGVVL